MIKREIRKELEKRLPQHVLDYLSDKFDEFEKALEKIKELEKKMEGNEVQGFSYNQPKSYGYGGISNHYDYDTPYMARRGGYDGGYGAVNQRQRDEQGRFMDVRGDQGTGQSGPSSPSNDQRGRVRSFPRPEQGEQGYEF